MRGFRFSTTKDAAFLAYIAKRWFDLTGKGPGRTQLQKLCYFSKAKGIPFTFEFVLYRFGPFSQEIYNSTDSLILDGVLLDQRREATWSHQYIPGDLMEEFISQNWETIVNHKADLDLVVESLEGLDPQSLELISTIHYARRGLKDYYDNEPTKDEVVELAYKAKKAKFAKKVIAEVYEILLKNGLLGWGNGLT
jgi:uncharacterized protein YwgA